MNILNIAEIAEYDEGSPYLPRIPEKLDEEIHGTPSNKAQLIVKENIPENYLPGYQQVEPLENNQGKVTNDMGNILKQILQGMTVQSNRIQL